jgi:phospholipase D3/4
MDEAQAITLPRPRAQLVETIPAGLDDLGLGAAAPESTGAALVRLVEAARATIDLTALYWSLRPSPDEDDTAAWTVAELIEQFGAGQGVALYAALDAAAARGVRLRLLESPGFAGDDAPPSDSATLRAAHPDLVDVRTVDLAAWYGGGVMHQKLWIVDGQAIYLGSANTDWRSLSQVKELGVVVEGAPGVAADAARYFEAWWAFAGSTPATVVVFDPASRIERRVPAWSALVAADARTPSPLDGPQSGGASSWAAPLRVRLDDEDGEVVLSGAPRELCTGGRTDDEDVLVATILDARRSVGVNVMDFAPLSLYRPGPDDDDDDDAGGPVWWPALVDALLHAVVTNGIHARLLVSEWAHTSPVIAPLLVTLDATAHAALAHTRPTDGAGQLEIRRFRLPGWRLTAPPQACYPGHTRVNHAKYVVTDRRINVGTSNLTWDYFNGTAGTSFNATHPALVRDLQARFDRDWSSDCALPLGG